jgi:hypothetical protein
MSMIQMFQRPIFRLYEQPRIRNWFYTLAFAIFVPTGLRFAMLAWEYGDWFDKPLSIISGIIIGITAVVTLLRVWQVPPRKTVAAGPATGSLDTSLTVIPSTTEILAAAKGQAAQNRRMAKEAAALGSSRGWPFSL